MASPKPIPTRPDLRPSASTEAFLAGHAEAPTRPAASRAPETISPPPQKKVPFSIRLDLDLFNHAKQLSRLTGVTITDLVERGLRAEVDRLADLYTARTGEAPPDVLVDLSREFRQG